MQQVPDRTAVDPPPGAQVETSKLQRALRIAGLLLGVGLFGYTLRDLNLRDLGTLLADLGPLFALVLLPQAVGTLVHTAAWKELLAALKSRAPYFALTDVYVQSEAIRMALPAGPALSESFSVWAAKSRFGVPWPRSLAAIAAKKAWVLCTHGLCFVLLLLIGQGAFTKLAASIPGGFALGWVAAGTAVALFLAGSLTIALLASRRVGRMFTRLAARLPITRLRTWAREQQDKPVAQAAATISVKSHLLSAFFLLAQWATEIAETWLILHLVGIPVTFTEAMVVELGGSLVRSLAFVVPGGLGVQDASYVSLLSGLGVAGSAGAGGSVAAFVLLKRTKDIFYVALGLALFGLRRRAGNTDRNEAAPLPAALAR